MDYAKAELGSVVVKRLDCGHVVPDAGPSGALGYGADPSGRSMCRECCAGWERDRMIRDERAALYLTRNQVLTGRGMRAGSYVVTDWLGGLRFPVQQVREGRHNIARTRTDVWFTGPDCYVWHGVQYGEWTQVVHCKRTRQMGSGW